jgi:putative flippase GtrA
LLSDRERLKTVFFQGIKYGITGVLGILTNLSVFSFLIYVLKVWYLIASPIAGLVSMTQNFILHRKFTFRGYSNFKIGSVEGLKRYIRFVVLSFVSGFLLTSAVYFQVDVMKFPPVLAQFNGILGIGFFNFLVARRFIYL